jgi:UDP-4-amino-4-deoxy-L-arabinose formyltransferase/UDP-glucuronic acid dehydrogenase (UDP-4-keto-hexauronic acid decarboxylating)
VAEESAGIQVLRSLAAGPHDVVAAMTAPPTRGGGTTVAKVAEQLGVPVVPSERVREPETAEWVREQGVDLLLNVHSLYLIHADVVAAPQIGSFNLHPGPLPRYAGLNAPSWAIYNGESRHAVTVHWMEPGVDTGAIAYETWFDLTESDTGLSVSVRCAREGVALMERLLEDAPDSVPATAQDLSQRRYYRRGEVPDDGRISWNQPARRIVDLVRASDYFPFPSPWGIPQARLDGEPLPVLKASRTAEPADAEPGTVGEGGRVAAADEWVLVERVEADGKPQPAAEALTPGSRLE